jgi:hypothetical protein
LDIFSAREIVSNNIADSTDTENTAGITSGGILASDTGPSLARVNGATDKATRVIWATSDVTEVALPPVYIPANANTGGDWTVKLIVDKDANTDTSANIDVQAFAGTGDTEMGGTTAAITETSPTLKTVTIDSDDIPAAPNFMNFSLIPSAHANDVIRLYCAWVEYTETNASILTAADLSDDVDNRISFMCIFRNTSIGGAAAT